MTPLGYASDILKTLEHEKKDLLEEQANKEEKFIHIEEERQVIIEMETKSRQQEQDFFKTSQLENQFNNVHIGGGNKSPPLTPPESKKNGKHWREPSPSPSPRGRRTSRHDDYRRPTPPRVARQPSQQAHHGSRYGGGGSNVDHHSYDFMVMQQNPKFQQYVEAYMQKKQRYMLSMFSQQRC